MIQYADQPERRRPNDFSIQRFCCDLDEQTSTNELYPCQDLDDVLGGIARGFKLMETCPTDDAYAPEATLVMNLGVLSGTQFMTGLRTFFHAYSPLKRSLSGRPSAMWSAGSGKFGTKLRFLGVEEVIFTGRASTPILLHIHRDAEDSVQFSYRDASHLVGQRINDKVQTLYAEYPEAHFAVIGPAGEHFETVRFASIGLSTENQLKSGDPKARYCGRGGMGGIMGSKNLLAIVADTSDSRAASAKNFKQHNLTVAKGDGSRRFRDKDTGGLGGTWNNYVIFNSAHAMPEMNFTPTGTDQSNVLYRQHVQETQPFVIKDESCYRCGIRCHKNVYEKGEDGNRGKFRAKLDFEPLNLLSSNLGIFDVDQACTLVELVDELGMDSISLGVTLGYAMEFNRRHKSDGTQVADGLSFGDFAATKAVIESVGDGEMAEVGQGTLRLAEQTGEKDYAMHGKGVEYPAYLPQINPGYPWALAGGHMSMRTFFIAINERETDLDYWVDAITDPNKGLAIIRDDILGICKFAAMSNDDMADVVSAITGLEVDAQSLADAVLRAFLRGYRLEQRQGFVADDYVLPAQSHEHHSEIDLPYFNTPSFFDELRSRVTARFEAMLDEHAELLR